jgi:hypothetical protein
MSKTATRKQRQAARLMEQAVRQYAKSAKSRSSFNPNTDTSVTTFERYVKKLDVLASTPETAKQFWLLLQKVHLRLLKQTLKLRD